MNDMTSPRSTALWLLLVMSIQTGLLAMAAWTHSPTADEPAHLCAGIHHWRTATTTLYRVNPPLTHLLATAPVMPLAFEFDNVGFSEMAGARPEFAMGERLVSLNGPRTMTLVRTARMTLIPWAVLGTWWLYRWAAGLSNSIGGLVAATIWAASPMVLGHGALFTPDVTATVVGSLAIYALWRADPYRPSTVVIAALATGVAICTKTTHLLLIPIAVGLLIARAWRGVPRDRRARLARSLGTVSLWGIVVLLTINICYGLPPVGRRLGDFQFVSRTLSGIPMAQQPAARPPVGNRFASNMLGRLPVPLPDDLVTGIDMQRRDFEFYRQPSYLAGQFRDHGWWHYYVWVVLFKTPLPTLVLGAFAVAATLHQLAHRRVMPHGIMFCWVIAGLYFLFISSQSGISQHGRYLLPAYPPAIVAIGAVLGRLVTSGRWAWQRAVSVILPVIVLNAALWAPHHLSYFNIIAGGWRGGPSHLLHSNIDWGQDLLRLRDWAVDRRSGEKDEVIYLAVCELYNPFDLIDGPFQPWPRSLRVGERPESDAGGQVQVPEGLYAITVNRLWGAPLSACDREGRLIDIDPTPLKHLRQMQPVAIIGGSIWIFDDQQVRRAYTALPGKLAERSISDPPRFAGRVK